MKGEVHVYCVACGHTWPFRVLRRATDRTLTGMRLSCPRCGADGEHIYSGRLSRAGQTRIESQRVRANVRVAAHVH